MSNRLAEIEQRQAAYKAYYPSDSDLWPTALRQALSDVDWLVAEHHKAEWISVKDRLPENGQPVLFAEYQANYSSIAISGEYWSREGFTCIDAREGIHRGTDVRYWMPLPAMPKE